jgi:hypothetical protein
VACVASDVGASLSVDTDFVVDGVTCAWADHSTVSSHECDDTAHEECNSSLRAGGHL